MPGDGERGLGSAERLRPTGRSTRPYIACRHLGLHFMQAKTPSCCYGPVSFVRSHKRPARRVRSSFPGRSFMNTLGALSLTRHDRWVELFSDVGWLLNHHFIKKTHREAFIRGLQLPPVCDVLDVACGIGAWTHLFSNVYSSAKIVGIDRSQSTIAYANSTYRGAPNAPQFQVSDARTLPFPDGSFDCVFSANCIGYFDDLSAVLLELRRVIKPGGRLILRQYDDSAITIQPCDPGLLHKSIAAAYNYELSTGPNRNFLGSLLSELTVHMHASQRCFSVETILIPAPFTAHEQRYIVENLTYLAWRAQPLLSEMECRKWEEFLDTEHFAKTTSGFYMMSDFVAQLTI